MLGFNGGCNVLCVGFRSIRFAEVRESEEGKSRDDESQGRFMQSDLKLPDATPLFM